MRSLVRGGVAGVAGAVVAAGSQFLVVVAITRGLDARTAGAFFTATTLCLMIAGVVRLDAGNGLIYFIARARDHGYHGAARHLRAALVPVVALSVAAAVLVTVHADAIAAALLPGTTPPTGPGLPRPAPHTGEAALADTLRVLGVALPVLACADTLVAATRGFGTMRPTTLLGGLLQPGAQLVLIGTLALTGLTGTGAWLLPAAWSLPALPVLLLSARWLHRRIPGPLGSAPASPLPKYDRTTAPPPSARTAVRGRRTGAVLDAVAGCWRPAWPSAVGRAGVWGRRTRPVPVSVTEFWRYAGPRAVGGAVQAVFQRLDIVVVGVLAGPEQAAVYTAATRFKVVGQLVNQGLAQAVQPRLVRAMARGDLPSARRLHQTATMWLVAVTWPVWLGYAALAPWVLGVFGDGYRRGAAVAAVLAVTMMAATACGMVDVVLIAAGHTTASTVNVLLAIAVTVAVDLSLVPSHGALGATLGWSAGVLTKNALPLLQLARWYGLSPFGPHSRPALRRATARHGDHPARPSGATTRTNGEV
ncbi:lipopolysaccharide biosynthesis protein [Sphaerisporangium sp. TRM90804]|uniref:lipopolysaccharide biosynthesis protein n=1 Tax=Sphaerisporangium sp. TRM90804 TaxID=3031113 RepID=UPI00244CFD1B|nr:lipopolysaccharide biosynthesis protein [Sphaerisporangium sp. TRM90804]MDH2428752.1 lipopolysaccharide biosynthesis protein [Sphaerisporangium sp. TRM90804]